MILKKEAINSISQKLNLPITGYEQDWEIELANSERVTEFISVYQEQKLLLEEKKALMSLIFASYDDYLNEKGIDKDDLWLKIVPLIELDRDLFEELLSYWSLAEENSSEYYFKITPLVRGFFK